VSEMSLCVCVCEMREMCLCLRCVRSHVFVSEMWLCLKSVCVRD